MGGETGKRDKSSFREIDGEWNVLQVRTEELRSRVKKRRASSYLSWADEEGDLDEDSRV